MNLSEKLFPGNKRYFIRPGITDMRKSIGTLSSMVENNIGISPLTEDYFLFSNRQKNIIKILYWHMNGFALWTKKLEKDKFPWPGSEEDLLEMTEQQIHWLLSGIDARREHKPIKYYRTG